MELRIEAEFRDKIPPLTQEEFDQLRDNILEDGEIYEPIAVWNGVIIDGHNRWKIYQEHPELPEPKIAEKHFNDKYEAFAWMYKKQLGRRNLTEQQRTYMIGKMYEAKKRAHGNNTERGDGGKYRSYQNGNFGNGKTGNIMAKELGIGYGTVVRSADYAKGIDAIREDAPEVADKILQGGAGATKTIIMEYPNMEDDDKAAFVDAVKSGEKPKRPSTNPDGYSSETRKMAEEIKNIVSDMYDPTVPDYSLGDLTEEIKANGEQYIKQLDRTLKMHEDLFRENMEAQDSVAEVITTVLIEKINIIMEGIING